MHQLLTHLHRLSVQHVPKTQGYLRLLEVADRIVRASESNARYDSWSSLNSGPFNILMPYSEPRNLDAAETHSSSPPTLSSSQIDCDVQYTMEVEAELLHWENFATLDIRDMGTIGLVEFWKVCLAK
jgi:hypothetical protein